MHQVAARAKEAGLGLFIDAEEPGYRIRWMN